MTLPNNSLSLVKTSDSVLGSPDGVTVQGAVNVALTQLIENDRSLNERTDLLRIQVDGLLGGSDPGGGGGMIGIPFYQDDKSIIYANQSSISNLFTNFTALQNSNSSEHLQFAGRLAALEAINPGQPYNITLEQLSTSLVNYIDSNSGGSSPIPEGSFTPVGNYPVNTAGDMSSYTAGQSYWTALEAGQAGGSFDMERGDWLLWNGGTAGTDSDWTFVSQGGGGGSTIVNEVPYGSISRVHLSSDLWFPFWNEDIGNYEFAIKDLNDHVAFGLKSNGEIAGVTSLEVGTSNGLTLVKDYANLKEVISFGSVEGLVPLANHTLDGTATEMPFAVVDRDNYSPFYITDLGEVYVHGASFNPEPEHSFTIVDQDNNILIRIDGSGVFVPVWNPSTPAIGGVDLSAVNATLADHETRISELETDLTNVEASIAFSAPASLIDVPRNINRTLASFKPANKLTTVVIGDSFVSGDETHFAGFTAFSWYGLFSGARNVLANSPLSLYTPSKEVPPISFVHNRGMSYELANSMGGMIGDNANPADWGTNLGVSFQDVATSFNIKNSQIGCRYPVKDADGNIYYGVQPSAKSIKTTRSGDLDDVALLPAFVSISLSVPPPATIYSTIVGVSKGGVNTPSDRLCIPAEYLFDSFIFYDGVNEKIRKVGGSVHTISNINTHQPLTTGLFLGERGLDYVMNNIPYIFEPQASLATSCLYTFDIIQNAKYFPPFYNSDGASAADTSPLPMLRFFVQKIKPYYVGFNDRRVWHLPLPIFAPVEEMTGNVNDINAPKAVNSDGVITGAWAHFTNSTGSGVLVYNVTKDQYLSYDSDNLEDTNNVEDGDVLEITVNPSWFENNFSKKDAAAYYIGVPFMSSYLEHYVGAKFLGYEVVPYKSRSGSVERIISQGRSGGVLSASNPDRLPASGNVNDALNTSNPNEPYDPRVQFGYRCASNGDHEVLWNGGQDGNWSLSYTTLSHNTRYKVKALQALDIKTFAILGGANETYHSNNEASAEAAATLFVRSFFGYVKWYREQITPFTDFILIGQLPLHNENELQNTYHGLGINLIYQKMMSILSDSDTSESNTFQHSIGLFSLVRHMQFINENFVSSPLHPTSEVTMALNKSFNFFLEQ